MTPPPEEQAEYGEEAMNFDGMRQGTIMDFASKQNVEGTDYKTFYYNKMQEHLVDHIPARWAKTAKGRNSWIAMVRGGRHAFLKQKNESIPFVLKEAIERGLRPIIDETKSAGVSLDAGRWRRISEEKGFDFARERLKMLEKIGRADTVTKETLAEWELGAEFSLFNLESRMNLATKARTRQEALTALRQADWL